MSRKLKHFHEIWSLGKSLLGIVKITRWVGICFETYIVIFTWKQYHIIFQEVIVI